MANPPSMRGELPFPEAGQGIVLRFTNPDCALLQKDFGDDWFTDALVRCNRSDITFLRTCYELGCKKDGKPARLKFDDSELTIAAIGNAVLNALFLAVMGRTFEGHLVYMEEQKVLSAKAPEDEDPNR